MNQMEAPHGLEPTDLIESSPTSNVAPVFVVLRVLVTASRSIVLAPEILSLFVGTKVHINVPDPLLDSA